MPNLTEQQSQLLHAYYAARRDTHEELRVSSKDLHEAAETVPYESDIAVMVMQRLDDYYLELRAEKIKQELKKNG